jgi:hypothetical protein
VLCVQTLQVQLHTAVPAKTKIAPAAALTFYQHVKHLFERMECVHGNDDAMHGSVHLRDQTAHTSVEVEVPSMINRSTEAIP